MSAGSNRGSARIVATDRDLTIYHGDALDVLRDFKAGAFAACITSPPYLDIRPEYPSPSLMEFRDIFAELRRTVTGPLLLNVGRLWVNTAENLWWVALVKCAQSVGWILRDTLIWVKPNANPIHAQVLANSHEYVFMFGDGFTPDAVRTDYDEESLARFTRRYRNGTGVKGDVREQDGREANELGARARSFFIGYIGREKGNEHPAPMALDLARHLVLLGSREGDEIVDPFAGSGTTGVAARALGREAVLIDRDESYCLMAADRLSQQSLFAGAT